MTYIEALYGSQYYEIKSKGRDGAAGRLNGNLFLTAFIIICMLLFITLLATFSEDFSDDTSRLFRKLFGYSSGKAIGHLLAIPLMGIIYLVVSKTVGSAAKYDKITTSFMEYTEEEKQKANLKILKPFFIVLGILFILMILSLF